MEGEVGWEEGEDTETVVEAGDGGGGATYPGGSGEGGGGGGNGGGGSGGGGEGARKTCALLVAEPVRCSMGNPMRTAKSLSFVLSYRAWTASASTFVFMNSVKVTRTLAASRPIR